MENRSPPIYKRILPLICTFALLISTFAFPVFADEADSSGWFDLLDYGYPNGLTGNRVPLNSSGQTEIVYSNPTDAFIYDYDIVFRTDSTDFRVATANTYLTVVSVGDGIYRAFGYHGRQNANSYFYFRNNDGTYVEILSARASIRNYTLYNLPVVGEVHQVSAKNAETYTSGIYKLADDNPSNTVNLGYWSDQTYTYYVDLDISDWVYYDSVQLTFSTYCENVDTVSVWYNGNYVPAETNIVLNTQASGLTDLYIVDVIIDVTGLPKVTGTPLSVTITGSQIPSGYRNFIIQQAVGIIDLPEPSLWTYWFTQVGSWLTTGFNSLGETVASWGTTVANTIGTQGSYITQGITAQTNSIVEVLQTQFDTLVPLLTDWTKPIPKALNSINNNLISIKNNVVSGFESVSNWISEQTTSINNTISTWGQNIVDVLSPQADKEGFREEVENIRDQMQNANDTMNELERPDVDDVFSDVDLDIGEGSPFVQIMGTLFENEFIVSIVTGSLAFSIFGLLVG